MGLRTMTARSIYRFAYFLVIVVGFGVLSSGCATKAYQQIQTLEKEDAQLQVLLMPLDVELYTLTAAGLLEPNANWTLQAEQNLKTAIVDIVQGYGADVVPYVPGVADQQRQRERTQLLKLHEAVGRSILQHKYVEQFVLPTKANVFDWTLGPKVQSLRDEYDADYALFIHLRDSYTSAGRVVAQVLAAALFGAYLPGGQQFGFASLVDLDNGDVAWFNRLSRAAGDVRELAAARHSATLLLENFPR